MIKPKPASFDEMGQGNKSNNSMMIAGFDAIKTIIVNDRKEASELINFLLSKGQMSQCYNYQQHLLEVSNRYMHTPVEVCDLRDVDAIISLLIETIKKINENEIFDFIPCHNY